ncbi:MAG: flagellar brake protein [Ideonella sp.]|jgi:flagellar brake protein|nr:flagellar brake protein [Ideonella sp.]MBL0151012.1 flagellar brake protein [Ideonella sp.]
MAFLDTQPAVLDAHGASDPNAAFRVHDPREVLALMRQLNDTSTPIQVSSPSGAGLDTVLWSVDGHTARISLRAESNDSRLPTLIAGDEATAVAYLDAVKLQFDLEELVLVRSVSSCALQARLPATVLRLQRRQAYRVRTLERAAPQALFRHPALPEMQLSLRVLDLSIGGCSLLLPDDVPPLEVGGVLHGVRMELDPVTRLAATLKLQHVTSIQPQSHGARLGCELQGMTPEAERTLQRYIDQTQKRRRLLSIG